MLRGALKHTAVHLDHVTWSLNLLVAGSNVPYKELVYNDLIIYVSSSCSLYPRKQKEKH